MYTVKGGERKDLQILKRKKTNLEITPDTKARGASQGY